MAVTMICVFFLILGLCGMSGTVVWVIRRGNNNRVTRLFAMCQVAIILWLISQLLILFSEVRTQYWISYIIGNLGISLFAPLWLGFTIEFSGARKRLVGLTNALPLITVISFLTVVTNPLHKMYYAVFDVHKIEYGPLFYVFQLVYYICIIVGITLMAVKFARKKNQITKQAILLILSTAVPLSVNTLTLFHVIRSRIEITPLFFAFSSIMLLIAVGCYGLLNINSLAMRGTVENMNIGVVIFDNESHITYMNDAMKKMTGAEEISDKSGFFGIFSSDRAIERSSNVYDISGHFFSLTPSVCKNRRGVDIATIITVNDVTDYYELAETEKKLSIEQERNRIAQEMHDSAGHTFTMISSLSKIAAVEVSKDNFDKAKISESLADIDGLSRSGVTQLRCSINNLREDEFMTTVTKAIQTVIDAVRGVEIDFCHQGKEDERYAFCIRPVYDNVRETVTNAMRYAEASRIDIIAKFLGDRLEVFILDNGKGCGKIKENNGLRGIRERTEALGGSVRFMSVKGEGFTTIMNIPVNKEENV